MNSITQDMKYRQSLLTYAQKYGVSRASRKYNKSRSYIYFWRARYDGSLQSLACQSRRPHSHPNQHTPEELKLISDMHRRNPKLGIVELWARMRETRIYANHRKSLAGDAKGRLDSAGREEETLQTQTLRANAIPRSACSDRREGRTPTLYCRPAAKAVSVHRH